MTRWTITLTSNSPDDDSKILELMKRAAKSGLKYGVVSKEIPELTITGNAFSTPIRTDYNPESRKKEDVG